MTSEPITTELAALLSKVRTPGDFHAAGTSTMPLPQVDVDGVGPVALPLLPLQAAQLIAVAERAPFGRGEETLIDTRVRRTWQIAADHVHIQGKQWARSLDAIVARVAAGLGVGDAVVPELYKLLVYDPGSFFVSHRDTEKAPGMFATLLVALPSRHAGGELLVRHKGREVRLDLRGTDPSEAAFAAFYADCTHEVLPVTAGCRLVLVYNLLREGRGPRPQPPDHEAVTAGLAKLLQRWSADKSANHAQAVETAPEQPEKLVYLLEHAYTPAELSFQMLKGADAGAAAVLAAAAQQADCELHVVLLTIEESGSAEQTGGGWGRHDDDEFEIGEVFDKSMTLTHWGRPDGTPAAFGSHPFSEPEVSPTGALEDMEPDEESFQEATGNEGASFERTYQRAALVLWPRQRRLAVMNQAGLSATLPWLAEMGRRWAESGAGVESPLWQEAHELAGHMLSTWPKAGGRRTTPERSELGEMLALLSLLKDSEHIEAFVADIGAGGQGGKGDNEALLQALALLPAARAGGLLERVVASHASAGLGDCCELLVRAAQSGLPVSHLHAAARTLVHALPGDPAQAQGKFAWRVQPAAPACVVDLMTALWRIDPNLSAQAVSHMLAWPSTWGLDAVIVPAVRSLVERPEMREFASGQTLRAACLEHLHARTALPLVPPADWSRGAALPCACGHCRELARFLASPAEQTWGHKAAEAERSHLMSSIQQAGSDVECATDRRGRPYTLVCTKNQASYDKRAAQREQDVEDLARLA